MDRIEFGALVASLRQDLRWTQAELAEKSELPQSVIIQVEKGEMKSSLVDDMLLKFANGLLLTSLERREFLMVASGVTTPEMLRPDFEENGRQLDIQAYLKDIGTYIAGIPLPVMVTDSFCDGILANNCITAFFSPSPGIISQLGKSVGSFNLIHSYFHRDADFMQRLDEEDWDRIATITVRQFRLHTLRFRTRSYFSALMKQFLDHRKYPYFERYWRKVAFEFQDSFSAPMVKPKSINDLSYWSTDSFLAVTPYGELYLQQMLPLNKATEKRIRNGFKTSGPGYLSMAPFPDQRKL
jgi:transcriptional regulator with XRE-family HTH domain